MGELAASLVAMSAIIGLMFVMAYRGHKKDKENDVIDSAIPELAKKAQDVHMQKMGRAPTEAEELGRIIQLRH